MTKTMPSAKDIVSEVLDPNPNVGVNSLHAKAFERMIYYRLQYYENSVDSFLYKLDLPDSTREKIKKEMLKPVKVEDKEYSNFMEEVARRVSQAFQPISGNIAEICAERELIKVGLLKDINYLKRQGRTDYTVFYPSVSDFKMKHRIEVKNVTIRERATRGLVFDGDSLFGFFNDEDEFTRLNVLM